MKWFTGVKTIEALKREYKKLAVKYHPDICGSDTEMKEINAEYDIMFARLKDIHESAEGTTYKKETNETANEFKDIINALIHLQGINIEVCGSWLWITGNTYPHRAKLKELKFRFSKSKTAWYYHTEGYRKSSKKTFTLNEIRDFYGSETIMTEPQLRVKLV